jgi:hypothetical protein
LRTSLHLVNERTDLPGPFCGLTGLKVSGARLITLTFGVRIGESVLDWFYLSLSPAKKLV